MKKCGYFLYNILVTDTLVVYKSSEQRQKCDIYFMAGSCDPQFHFSVF